MANDVLGVAPANPSEFSSGKSVGLGVTPGGGNTADVGLPTKVGAALDGSAFTIEANGATRSATVARLRGVGSIVFFDLQFLLARQARSWL